MEKYYKIDEFLFIEIGFNEKFDMWYADLIDIILNKKIATIANTDIVKLIADIIRDDWFSSNNDNFALFIEDILKMSKGK